MAKKVFTINTSDFTEERNTTISLQSRTLAGAYLADSLRHMEEGKLSKVEVIYGLADRKQGVTDSSLAMLDKNLLKQVQ
jgi:hypothetical protein